MSELSDKEAAHQYRLMQAQEIQAVLFRHGVRLLEPWLKRLQCERCGHEYDADIQPLPGLVRKEQKIVPGSGQLPFTGWRCPHGCSERTR
jgi:hypothetical protein